MEKFLTILLVLLLLSACVSRQRAVSAEAFAKTAYQAKFPKESPLVSSAAEKRETANADDAQNFLDNAPSWETQKERTLPLASDYIRGLARQRWEQVTAGIDDPVDQIAAVYADLISRTYFAVPTDFMLWRYNAQPDIPPSYEETRALWPLLLDVGSCEDFAAALTVMLQEGGFAAEYVSGLTVSVAGNWVDHAWTVVQVGENWYHLDSQLEQNIIKNKQLTFRYFLKGDGFMGADHLWGERLADHWYGRQSQEQLSLLRQSMTPPACREDYPQTREPLEVELPNAVSPQAVQERIQGIKAYAHLGDKDLQPILQDTEPPLFRLWPESLPRPASIPS